MLKQRQGFVILQEKQTFYGARHRWGAISTDANTSSRRNLIFQIRGHWRHIDITKCIPYDNSHYICFNTWKLLL